MNISRNLEYWIIVSQFFEPQSFLANVFRLDKLCWWISWILTIISLWFLTSFFALNIKYHHLFAQLFQQQFVLMKMEYFKSAIRDYSCTAPWNMEHTILCIYFWKWSHDLNTDPWFVDTGHVTLLLASCCCVWQPSTTPHGPDRPASCLLQLSHRLNTN